MIIDEEGVLTLNEDLIDIPKRPSTVEKDKISEDVNNETEDAPEEENEEAEENEEEDEITYEEDQVADYITSSQGEETPGHDAVIEGNFNTLYFFKKKCEIVFFLYI